jgi:hypothetical protein
VHRDHKSLTAGQPVLASARLLSPDVPDPDVGIDSEYKADTDEQNWADHGINKANSVLFAKPQQDGLQVNEADLHYESDRVVAQEDITIFEDYTDDLSSDPDFRDQLCKVLADADFLINILNYNPDDPTQVDDYLLKQSSDPAAKAVEGVLDSTRGLFQQTFPQCTSNLDTTKWIIEQLRKLWCGEE